MLLWMHFFFLWIYYIYVITECKYSNENLIITLKCFSMLLSSVESFPQEEINSNCVQFFLFNDEEQCTVTIRLDLNLPLIRLGWKHNLPLQIDLHLSKLSLRNTWNTSLEKQLMLKIELNTIYAVLCIILSYQSTFSRSAHDRGVFPLW